METPTKADASDLTNAFKALGLSESTRPFDTFGSEEYPVDDEHDLGAQILEIARITALAHRENSDEFDSRMQVFRQCQKLGKEERFRVLLQETSLANCRSTNLEQLAPDSQTPLHTAAMHNNLRAAEILIYEFHASAWAIDLRGRTPLHLAAEHGYHDMCKLLRTAMKIQKNIDPIGKMQASLLAKIQLNSTTAIC